MVFVIIVVVVVVVILTHWTIGVQIDRYRDRCACIQASHGGLTMTTRAFLSACLYSLSVYLSARLSVCLSPFTKLHACLADYILIRSFFYNLRQSVSHQPACQPACLSAYLSACLSVCLLYLRASAGRIAAA